MIKPGIGFYLPFSQLISDITTTIVLWGYASVIPSIFDI